MFLSQIIVSLSLSFPSSLSKNAVLSTDPICAFVPALSQSLSLSLGLHWPCAQSQPWGTPAAHCLHDCFQMDRRLSLPSLLTKSFLLSSLNLTIQVTLNATFLRRLKSSDMRFFNSSQLSSHFLCLFTHAFSLSPTSKNHLPKAKQVLPAL